MLDVIWLQNARRWQLDSPSPPTPHVCTIAPPGLDCSLPCYNTPSLPLALPPFPSLSLPRSSPSLPSSSFPFAPRSLPPSLPLSFCSTAHPPAIQHALPSTRSPLAFPRSPTIPPTLPCSSPPVTLALALLRSYLASLPPALSLWATARSLLPSSLPPSIPSSLIPSLAPHPSSPPPSPPFAPSLPLPSARLLPPSIWFTFKCRGEGVKKSDGSLRSYGWHRLLVNDLPFEESKTDSHHIVVCMLWQGCVPHPVHYAVTRVCCTMKNKCLRMINACSCKQRHCWRLNPSNYLHPRSDRRTPGSAIGVFAGVDSGCPVAPSSPSRPLPTLRPPHALSEAELYL